MKFRQLRYGTDENPVEVRISGDNWTQLRQVADSLTGVLRRNKDLRLVRADVNEPLPSVNITLDPVRASRLGINNLAVETTMAMRYNSDGLALGSVWEGDYKVNICLKGNHADNASISNVENEQMTVFGSGSVPLRQVATVKHAWHDGQIPHRNGIRCISILAENAQGVNATKLNKNIKEQLSKVQLPDGVNISYGGELESNEENMPTLVGALAIAVVIIFFILLAHYRKIATTILLLASLSLHLRNSCRSMDNRSRLLSHLLPWGISLMGILVRNAIIMYDYAEELRSNGTDDANGVHHPTSKEAIYESAKRRIRPIFLTSAAASMGVIPMIIGGSGLWMPMGAVICFGTLITMLFILTVMPVCYWLVMSGSTRRRYENEVLEKQ